MMSYSVDLIYCSNWCHYSLLTFNSLSALEAEKKSAAQSLRRHVGGRLLILQFYNYSLFFFFLKRMCLCLCFGALFLQIDFFHLSYVCQAVRYIPRCGNFLSIRNESSGIELNSGTSDYCCYI